MYPRKKLAHPRFRDLDSDAVNIELHCHTTWTDGEAAVEAVVERARALGLRALAITEHVRRGSESWFSGFAAEVRAAGAAAGLDVLVGCEAKAMDPDGGLDASDDVLDASDLVIGSVHRFPDGQGGLLSFADLSADRMAEIETALATGLLRGAPIDVLGHPGGMYQRRHGAFPKPLMRDILEASLERDIAVEISTSYTVDLEGFLKVCSEVNPRVSIGSDAHRLDDVGRCRDSLLEYLART